MRHLILGGARSGKSAFAERLAEVHAGSVVYLATAAAADSSADPEMVERIAHHQARRPAQWTLVEEPLGLAEALQRQAAPDTLIIVDCLTLWLSNVLFADEQRPGLFVEQREQLLGTLPELAGSVVLVSNEVGLGIVPANALARRFRDEAGRLNQAVASCCEKVTLVAAGLPLALKGESL